MKVWEKVEDIDELGRWTDGKIVRKSNWCNCHNFGNKKLELCALPYFCK